MRGARVKDIADLDRPRSRIMAGLRSLFVFCNTGSGRSALSADAAAGKVVQSAWRDRRRLLSQGQQADLDAFRRDSKARSALESILMPFPSIWLISFPKICL